MSCCVCATTRPKSGTKRPNTPASLRRRNVVSGSCRDVSISMNRRLASGSVRRAVDQADVLGDQPQGRADGCRGRSPARHGTGAGSPPDPSSKASGEATASRSPSSRKPSSSRGRKRLPQGGELGLAAAAVLERGDEDAREIADRLGVKIVVLHEALDAAAARPVLVAQARGDLALQVERQAIVGAAGQIVDVAAHRRRRSGRRARSGAPPPW